MIAMTPALKEHLVKSFALKADATDDEALKLTATKFASGELTTEKITELTKTPDRVAELENRITDRVLAGIKAAGIGAAPAAPAAPVAPAKTEAEKMSDFDLRMKEMEDRFESRMAERVAAVGAPGNSPHGDSLLKMGSDFSKSDDPIAVRVKSHMERYGDDSVNAVRTKGLLRGQPIVYKGQQMTMPSEKRKAMAGVWLKYTLGFDLNEREQQVLLHILHKEKFINPADATDDETPVGARFLNAEEIHKMRTGQWFKADLINDSTSGGQYAVPQFFDYDYILLPVLGNELAPLCHIIDVPRGSAAANFTILNPSFAAANTEGSAVSAFDATSMCANHTTTFYRAAGFILLGLNFLSDAVPGLADEVLSRYGAKAAEWLDNMVAVGDGTNQPQGIMVASGTVNITLNTPTTGPYVLSDLSRLLFGVPKQYRNNYPKEQAAYGMTDTAYGKVRAIATGVTGDTRLIFGMDLESYKLFDHHVGILSGSSIGSVTMTNDDLFFCQLGGYRLYRRQGVRFYRETAGKTLRLANEMLIGADMRYGGQLDRGSYAAVATSGIP